MKELILPWPAKELSPNARNRWSKDEDDALRAAICAGSTMAEIAHASGRTVGSARNRAWNLGLLKSRSWTKEELDLLKALYSRVPLNCAEIAQRIGRTTDAVELKASRMGFGDPRRPKKRQEDIKPRNKYATIEEARVAIGNSTRLRIAEKGHPKGAMGLRHSEETKAAISVKSKEARSDPDSRFNTDAYRQGSSDRMLASVKAGKMRSGYSRSRGGKREDLEGVYFRSAWEANYARYLNMLIRNGDIASWEFEPQTFEFIKIKRGTRAYTPDFKVFAHDGSHVWHEVKGWMDAKSKTRLARFARYFPDEKLIVVDAKWFKSANKTIGHILAGWENGTVHV